MYSEVKRLQLAARKAKDTDVSPRVAAITTLVLGEVETLRKRGSKEADDQLCEGVVRKLLKSVEQTIELTAKNTEAAYALQIEADALRYFISLVPAMMSEAEIKAILEAASPVDIGSAMKAISNGATGAYDKKLASDLARAYLAK